MQTGHCCGTFDQTHQARRRIGNLGVGWFDPHGCPRELSRLRHPVSAGESVNPEVTRRWQQVSGVPLIESYGQTETLMTVANTPKHPPVPGSMGRPLPGVKMAILDESAAPSPAGERGQQAVRLPCPRLMLGYWNDPERTACTRVTYAGVEYS
ncbi:AMP-binding protein [Cupriavidus lacunae]|uniref:AMP-binding protein n=1 Tax=Cupriavidus lacunae TaxID=2666307 RepID=UPI00137515C2|nr:AMP-binding protein [Cupriavidus lacunae]